MTTALYRLRLARGQSLRQLAADVGCSYETIRRLERGQASAFPRTRAALERALGVPFHVLTAPLNATGDAPQDAAATTVTTAKKSLEGPDGD
jgi:transcriptional regulator with XRE-family HTH domain